MDNRSTRCNHRDAGFTYIGLLIALAALGISLAATGELWRTAAKREREQELLFVGTEFRNALASYYARGPGALSAQPRGSARRPA
jgi:type II secretory pathway pseudopilin PulG